MMEKRNKRSILGYGCMRLSGQYDAIEEQIMHAIERGVNYFDTAYVYPGNEALLGRVLENNHCRERVRIATKLPHYLARDVAAFDRMFNTQKKRLQTDYIDSYLLHMLPDTEVLHSLEKAGILEWVQEKKYTGSIREFGFSYHGNTEHFKELIDAFDWDFCQIQYNYIDEHTQAGAEGLRYAAEKGVPVIIMEPLRGGLLADKLPADAKKIFDETPFRGRIASPAEWGLRWLWDQPGVSCVLSGMTSVDMVDENIDVAESAKIGDLTEEEKDVYRRVSEAILASTRVGCTGCHYCSPCPFGVDIPGSFRCYNSISTDGYIRALREYFMTTSMGAKYSRAGLCRSCGKCKEHCPQEIDIPTELKAVKRSFENPIFLCASAIFRRMMTHRSKHAGERTAFDMDEARMASMRREPAGKPPVRKPQPKKSKKKRRKR